MVMKVIIITKIINSISRGEGSAGSDKNAPRGGPGGVYGQVTVLMGGKLRISPKASKQTLSLAWSGPMDLVTQFVLATCHIKKKFYIVISAVILFRILINH